MGILKVEREKIARKWAADYAAAKTEQERYQLRKDIENLVGERRTVAGRVQVTIPREIARLMNPVKA